MSDKLYKVTESWLTNLADAMRLQKKSAKKYTTEDMLKTLKAMLVLPSGLAESTNNGSITGKPSTASGINPTVYYGAANSTGGSTTSASAAASGINPIVYYGIANSASSSIASLASTANGCLIE